MSKNSLKAATLAAAKVNAMLCARGKLKQNEILSQMVQGNHSVTGERTLDNLITREYEINDVPAPARNLLTRGFVQDEICKYSGASISTRGRYFTLEERLTITTKDRPLYLHIQGSSKESVNLAMVRIQEMIAQFDKSYKFTSDLLDTSFSAPQLSVIPSTAPVTSSGGHFVQDKVFVGLESSSSAFSVRERILGPAGSYLQHIKTESGANVTLRGRGSGYIEQTSGQEAFEPLYIHLTHPKPEGLQTAKTLALNLIDTVHAEYAIFQQQSQQALMPVSMSQHLSFQSHVPVVSSVPAILNHSLTPSVAQGFVPVVTSVQTMLGHHLSPAVSQGVYTSNTGSGFGFHHSFVNTSPEISMNPVTSLPLNSISSLVLPINTLQNSMALSTAPSIQMNSLTSMPLNRVHSVSLDCGPTLSVNPVPSVTLDSVSSMTLNQSPSLVLNPVPSISMNPVTSMSSMLSVPMNPVTSMSHNSINLASMNSATSVAQHSVPLNLLPGLSMNNPNTVMQSNMGMCSQQMNTVPIGMHLTPPLAQRPTIYRDPSVQSLMMGMPQNTGTQQTQSLPPTAYTHLYIKQQQQQQLSMTSLQSGHQGYKRKFREAEPIPELGLMPPPSSLLQHQSSYRLGHLEPIHHKRPSSERSTHFSNRTHLYTGAWTGS